MNTAEKHNRKGWLSLGWLTDVQMVQEIKKLQTDLFSGGYGVPVPLSAILRTLLRKGLDAVRQEEALKRQSGPRSKQG